MTRRIWVAPDAETAGLATTVEQLGYAIAESAVSADLCISAAPVAHPVWVATVPTGREAAALAALEAGAAEVLRWPAPLELVRRILERTAPSGRTEPVAFAQAQRRLLMFSRVLESTNDGLALVDPEYRLIDWNPALARYMGLDESSRGSDIFEADVVERAAVEKAFREEGSFRKLLVLNKANDGARVVVDLQMFPITDDEGRLLAYASVGRDVTELKDTAERLAEANRELQAAQAQLLQSEKMASLGMMVAGIAHEINTPMGAIASMQDTLDRALTKLRARMTGTAEDTELKKLFDVLNDATRTTRTGTRRVTTIVKRLRSFARLDEAELKACDLHEALEDTILLMHHELKRGFTVVRRYGSLPEVACYAGRLNQVFLNLLMNAKQASTPPAELVITTGNEPGWVWVAIEDFGDGISEENLPKIFDPGFTTKGAGVGVGLGLAICYRIVEEHEGRIQVKSVAGKGTTFTVWIPTDLAQRTAGTEPAEPAATEPAEPAAPAASADEAAGEAP